MIGKHGVLSLAILLFCTLDPALADGANDCGRHVLAGASQVYQGIPYYVASETERNKYLRTLRGQLGKLKNCADSDDLFDPDVYLQIRIMMHDIRTKINSLESGEKRPRDPASLLRYKERKRIYLGKFDSFDSLKCDDCIKILKTYYSKLKARLKDHLRKGGRLYEIDYSADSITALWGLLYRISRSQECTEKSREIIRNIMLPYGMPPELLIDAVVQRIMDHPREFIRLLDALKDFSDKEKALLLRLFTDVASNSNSHNLYIWEKLIESINKIDSEQQRTIMFEMLPNMQWENLANLIRDVASKESGTDIVICIENFLLTERPETPDRRVEMINDTFREVFSERYKVTPKKTEDVLCTIDGRLSMRETEYILTIRFLSRRNFVILTESVEIHRSPLNKTEIRHTFQEVLDKFENLIGAITQLPLSKSELIIKYTDFKRVEAFINEDVYEDSKVYELMDKTGLRDIAGVYISGDHFWEKEGERDKEAIEVFGGNFRELIVERINKAYIGRKQNAILLKEPPGEPCVIVRGQYNREVNKYPLQNQSSISIFYDIGTKRYSEYTIHFPEKTARNKDSLIKMLAAKVGEHIANFFGFELIIEPPEEDGEGTPRLSDENEYVTSFFLPGQRRLRTYVIQDKKPPWHLKAWNYSNIALLGLALGSEAAYISGDYDNDTLFWTGVTATFTFIVNGVLGVVDAATYRHPENNAAGKTVMLPYVTINRQYGAPMLILTFKF